ncbi:MAG: hypothetical protein HZA78_12845 [Candidatus Schekmanbacteria bacterium]|nr:hypothetical protein [Candidatus Schekmanbacteria bacterium]
MPRLHKTHRFALPLEGVSLQEIEKSLLLQALALTRDNKSKAARLLRISRSRFCYRLKKYNLEE